MGRPGAALSLFQGRLRQDRGPLPSAGVPGKVLGPCAVLTGDMRDRLEQGCRPASRGPAGKTVGLKPAGFSGRDLAGQIWPPLTLSVSPVGEEMRRPSLPSEHGSVFGQTLGRGREEGRSVDRVERGKSQDVLRQRRLASGVHITSFPNPMSPGCLRARRQRTGWARLAAWAHRFPELSKHATCIETTDYIKRTKLRRWQDMANVYTFCPRGLK